MKRVISMLLCLLLCCSIVQADESTTLPREFNAQFITGGNGLRGKISITASGTAEWLEFLQPFTAGDIQLRAIGMPQGKLSNMVSDDARWQVKLYTKNSTGGETGVTYFYTNGDNLYLSSELLPGQVLMVPTTDTHLLFDLARADAASLFFGFDPYDLRMREAGENPPAYHVVAELLGIPETEWEASWSPVLQKYYRQLDLWLTGYGIADVVNDTAGNLTMGVSYTIPADELKRQAKYLVGQMLFDSELQTLILPYVTTEERMIYLNPSMVYFYEACIDALPLTGDLVFSRQMSAMGEVIQTTLSLPIPMLPEKLTSAVNGLMADLFNLPYTDALDGVNRLVIQQEGDIGEIVLHSDKRIITLSVNEAASNAESVSVAGFVRIDPAVGADEPPLCASFTYKTNHTIYQDENYFNRDDATMSLRIEPDLNLLSSYDPFRSSYIDFSPLALNWKIGYRQDTAKAGAPVQINITLGAEVPDANVSADIVLRTMESWPLLELPVDGARSIATLTDGESESLAQELVFNAIMTMAGMNVTNAVPETSAAPDATAADIPAADENLPVPTAVPPMGDASVKGE